LRQVSPGFNPQNVLAFSVALPEARYPTEKQAPFFQDLTTQLGRLPGVQSVSAVLPLPLSGDRFSLSFAIEGRPVAKRDEPSADYFTIAPGYFRTMGIPIVKGRDFDDRDQHKSTQVIIISDTFARRHFPGEDPIGKRIRPGISTFDNEPAVMREIVRVVGDVRNRTLNTEGKPTYYTPQSQVPFGQVTFVVKTDGDPRGVITAVTNQV